jgi:hypothetical protein
MFLFEYSLWPLHYSPRPNLSQYIVSPLPPRKGFFVEDTSRHPRNVPFKENVRGQIGRGWITIALFYSLLYSGFVAAHHGPSCLYCRGLICRIFRITMDTTFE